MNPLTHERLAAIEKCWSKPFASLDAYEDVMREDILLLLSEIKRLREELANAQKWKEEDPRMLREQVRVADVAYRHLHNEHKELQGLLRVAHSQRDTNEQLYILARAQLSDAQAALKVSSAWADKLAGALAHYCSHDSLTIPKVDALLVQFHNETAALQPGRE